jgi:hypothetical protein
MLLNVWCDALLLHPHAAGMSNHHPHWLHSPTGLPCLPPNSRALHSTHLHNVHYFLQRGHAHVSPADVVHADPGCHEGLGVVGETAH